MVQSLLPPEQEGVQQRMPSVWSIIIHLFVCLLAKHLPPTRHRLHEDRALDTYSHQGPAHSRCSVNM